MNQSIENPSNQSRIGQASIPMTKEELGFIHKNDIHATNQISKSYIPPRKIEIQARQKRACLVN